MYYNGCSFTKNPSQALSGKNLALRVLRARRVLLLRFQNDILSFGPLLYIHIYILYIVQFGYVGLVKRCQNLHCRPV